MSSHDPHTVPIGVKGAALRQQGTGDLALAQLRPTVPEHEIRRHGHADMHLLVLLSGRYVSEAEGMPDVCDEPAVILNPPGIEHRDRFRSRDGLFLTLTMPAPAFERLCGPGVVPSQAIRLPRPSLARAMPLLRELWHWEPASALVVETALGEMLADARPRTVASATHAKLRRVIERLDEDTTVPSLGELAAIAGCHPVYLARAFRRRYGIAPGDYLRRRRLHRAVSLIARGRTVARAAASLGFVDDSHLHRAFVAEFGMTPGAFRRLALGRAEVSRVQDAGLRRR
ncbi:MAG TPA: AraC family transcriptional regulator [Lysobacter sp.]